MAQGKIIRVHIEKEKPDLDSTYRGNLTLVLVVLTSVKRVQDQRLAVLRIRHIYIVRLPSK